VIASTGPGPTDGRFVTVGVDLASQADDTAVCIIRWGSQAAAVDALGKGYLDGRRLDDDALVDILKHGDKAAIDAPFGWPEPFITAISAAPGDWPLRPGDRRAPLERRTTDFLIHERTGKTPLSVSTDRIAYCAMRCASLLGVLDAARDGSGAVVEAYPDAALRCWLPALFVGTVPSYKTKNSDAAFERRELLLAGLLDQLGDGLKISDAHRFAIAASDDCLDALVCALIARAAERGCTVLPKTPEHQRLASVEGWIHLPEHDSLRTLTLT
jgi:hypothetical protein